eukprot:TRINITY_DN11421_c0_g1_i1.p1 TRINITY_DN11421_c0_g1~~TRINITY_DN11421_c0_g1_i1.p1  ORF type:complete len:136 (-),score=29.36 TRINITY_DN11421_c0_g1_i1:242-649(-)
MVSLLWGTIAHVLIPSGVLIFIFLSLPLGRFRLLGVDFINQFGAYGMNLATLIFFGCLPMVYWEYLTWVSHTAAWDNFQHSHMHGGAGISHELLSKKWKADRNLWIASMAAFVWLAVWSLAVNVKKQEVIKARQD